MSQNYGAKVYYYDTVLRQPKQGVSGFIGAQRGFSMLIGYARVSTDDQHLDQQRSALRAVDCQLIYEENLSGAQRQRPELNRLLDHLREGDVLVVTRLDRRGCADY